MVNASGPPTRDPYGDPRNEIPYRSPKFSGMPARVPDPPPLADGQTVPVPGYPTYREMQAGQHPPQSPGPRFWQVWLWPFIWRLIPWLVMLAVVLTAIIVGP